MTLTFNHALIAGISTPAICAKSIADLIRTEFQNEVQTETVELGIESAAQTLRDAGRHVIGFEDAAELGKWAPEGTDTWVIAGHDSPSVDPAPKTPASRTPQGSEIGGVGTLLALAGLDPTRAYATSRDLLEDIQAKYGAWSALNPGDEVWFHDLEMVRHMRSLALQNIGRRRLHVAAATARPLLGLDTTLAMDQNGHPVDVVSHNTLAELTRFYTLYTQVGEAEKLSTPVQSYARQVGTGSGLGLGALALGLRGALTPLADALVDATDFENRLDSGDLLIATLPQLHPQTVADSAIEQLGELAAQRAIPFIVFTHESSLSTHELSEWGIHAAYVVGEENGLEKVRRVVCGTWIRRT